MGILGLGDTYFFPIKSPHKDFNQVTTLTYFFTDGDGIIKRAICRNLFQNCI